jgi:hypothetical protein
MILSLLILSLFRRYQTPLGFPILETYPRIFDINTTSKNTKIHAALSTSSSIADSIRQLERSVRGLVPFAERENVLNGLRTIAEEYIEGWESGSDDDNNGDEDW